MNQTAEKCIITVLIVHLFSVSSHYDITVSPISLHYIVSFPAITNTDNLWEKKYNGLCHNRYSWFVP